MNYRSLCKNIKPANFLEASLMVSLVLFLALGHNIPIGIAEWMSSMFGMAIITVLSVYIFSQTQTKGLAILVVITACEIIRRSFSVVHTAGITGFAYDGRRQDLFPQNEIQRATHMASLNPIQPKTLEQTIIDREAPVGFSSASLIGPASEPVGEVGFNPIQASSQLIPSDAR